MVIQLVRFKSGLPDAEIRQMMKDRTHIFRALPGLLQKYYIRDAQTGEFGGVYVWESEEAMRAFRESDLVRNIPVVYKVAGEPRVEVLEVILPLRSNIP